MNAATMAELFVRSLDELESRVGTQTGPFVALLDAGGGLELRWLDPPDDPGVTSES